MPGILVGRRCRGINNYITKLIKLFPTQMIRFPGGLGNIDFLFSLSAVSKGRVKFKGVNKAGVTWCLFTTPYPFCERSLRP
jgi:hypothetical protein